MHIYINQIDTMYIYIYMYIYFYIAYS